MADHPGHMANAISAAEEGLAKHGAVKDPVVDQLRSAIEFVKVELQRQIG
jgi:hypothetical protein